MLALVTGSVTPTARGWTSAVDVTYAGAGQRAVFPRVVRDGQNRVHLVWTGGNDPSSAWQVWYQAFDGSSWTTAIPLTDGGGTRCDIAIDDADTLHVAYENDGEDDIWYRSRAAGGSWSTPVNLRTGGRSISPHIAANASGNTILVAWHEDYQVGGEWDIFVNVFSAGAWSGVQNVSTDSALSSEPRVAVDSAGAFHVLWQSNLDEIFYRRRGTDGVWGSKTRLDHTSERSGVGDVTVGPDGLVHVVWSEDSGDGGWEVYHRYNDGAGWSSPVNVSERPGDSDDVAPNVFADDAGRVYVAWHDYSHIFIRRKDGVGGAFGPRETVVSGWYQATLPDIVLSDDYVGHVFWQSRPTSADNWNIYHATQAYDPPGPRGTVTGHVRDQNGAGVVGANVTVGDIYSAVSGAGGAYSLLAVPGVYAAVADKPYFLSDTVEGVTVQTDATTMQDFAISGEPPASITDLSGASHNGWVRLTWTNPADARLVGTEIRFSTEGFPASPEDGLLVADHAGSPGVITGTDHEGLSNGTTYYYAAFAYARDATRYYASPATVAIAPAGPGDLDHDGDVDQADFGRFQLCLTGESAPQHDEACQAARFDEDEDVDNADLVVFLRCLSGADVSAASDCAD